MRSDLPYGLVDVTNSARIVTNPQAGDTKRPPVMPKAAGWR
jgi:hypothetical protein